MVRTRWVFLVITLALLGSAWAVLKKGKPIPSFQAALVDGKTILVTIEKGTLVVRMKGAKGSETVRPKVLILDFWATWCAPCHIVSQQLAQIYRRYQRKGVVVLGISIDEDGRTSVVPFLKKNKTPYLIALDPKASVANRFQIEGLPTIYVVNSKGTIVSVMEGIPEDPNSLTRSLEQAIRKVGVR